MSAPRRTDLSGIDGVEAPSAELAEAQRRAFINEVHDKPGVREAVAELAKLNGDEEPKLAAETTASGAPDLASARPQRVATVKTGLERPIGHTARSLQAVIRAKDAERAPPASAPVPKRRSGGLIVLGLVAIALVGALVYVVGTLLDRGPAEPLPSALAPHDTGAPSEAPPQPSETSLAATAEASTTPTASASVTASASATQSSGAASAKSTSVTPTASARTSAEPSTSAIPTSTGPSVTPSGTSTADGPILFKRKNP